MLISCLQNRRGDEAESRKLLLQVVPQWYQNFLEEFWSIDVAFDPFPSTDEPERLPLREFLKFSVLNGQRPLTLDFKTFYSSTGLDYNNAKYVLGGNYSSTEQVNSIQQLLAFSLITGTEVIGEIIYSDLVTKLLNKSRLKYVSYPRFISYALQVLLGLDYTQDKKFGFLPPILSTSNFTKDPSKVTDIELTSHMIAVNNQRESVSPPPLAAKSKKGKSQTVTTTLPKSQGPEASEALSKKSKRPKSKKPPTKSKASPPKPTEDYEQSHSVSSGTVPDPQDLERNIELTSMGLPSVLNKGTRTSKPFPEGTVTITHPKDLGGNIQPLDRDLTSMASDKGTAKTTPRPEGSLGDKDSRENIPPADMEPIHTTIADLSGTSANPDLKRFDNTLPFTEIQSIKYLRKMSRVLFSRITDKQWEQHKEAAVSYADLKASIEAYYDENIAHKDQTDKLVEASMSALKKSSTANIVLYKGLNVITELLKEINNAVKDDPVNNKKIDEAIQTFAKIYIATTEILSIVKGFDFSSLQSAVKDLQAHALKQDDQLADWAKSFTNMAWNLGSRISGLERAQNYINSNMSSLKEHKLSIKSMMNEMYAVFKGQPPSAPSGSVTPTLALTHIPANIEGENATHTGTKEPPSHTEGETDANIQEKPEEPKQTNASIEFIGSSTQQPQITLALPITIIHLEPIVLQREGKILPLMTKQRIKPSCSKPHQLLLAITKPEVIKVVQEEAEKIRLDPKKITSTKVGAKFKKAQDAEHEVLKRKHTERVQKSLMLRKHKYDSYMWTISSRVKPEPITDIKIHPKTKPVVITVYRGTDGRNFDVHKPFLFGEFGISKLDELREIILKKKNAMVKDLMNSLSRRWSDIGRVGMEALVSYLVDAYMVKSTKNARFNLKLKKHIIEHHNQEKLRSKKVKLEALGYKMD
ncbi:hypothetical protein Tco_0626257 [Tanacetum coccineum]|uniref:Uncharacterized protein n=1 Tax=Tanacetum coccineum TaxID=301880 RepID=A0ABQ4WJ31_9ASTR